MKSKKILTIIIILIVILVLGVGAFAYIYFATDLMKTNAQLFVKYGGKTAEAITEFFSNESVTEYYNKKLSNTYENSGSLKFKAEVSDMNIDDEIITFKGAVDKVNKKTQQTIDINYSDSEKFSFDYVRNNDLYALTSEEVVNKYIVIDNNNLKEFATKLGIDSDEIPDKIGLEEYKNKLTPEQLMNIKEKYLNIIKSQLTETDFSKEEGEQPAYILTISGDKLKTILINILEELKNETMITELIEDTDKITEYRDNIDENIQELQSYDFQNVSLKITVYKVENGIAHLKLEIITEEENLTINMNQQDINNININLIIEEKNVDSETTSLPYNDVGVDSNDNMQEMNLLLSKNIASDSIVYTFTSNIEDVISISTITLAGITTNNVTESYKIENLEEDRTVCFEYNNSIAFKDTVNIVELNDDNSVTLNSYNDSSELNNLLSQLIEQIVKVNTEKITSAVQKVESGEETGGIMYTLRSLIISTASGTYTNTELNNEINTQI